MVHLDSSSKMNFFEKPYAPLYGAAVRTNSHIISCAWRFFRRYKKKGWKILLIMFMQNFPEDKWSACFMFHLKTKISNDPSSDSADPAFISPEKKKARSYSSDLSSSSFRHVQIRVEMSFKPPTWLSFMHTTTSPGANCLFLTFSWWRAS